MIDDKKFINWERVELSCSLDMIPRFAVVKTNDRDLALKSCRCSVTYQGINFIDGILVSKDSHDSINLFENFILISDNTFTTCSSDSIPREWESATLQQIAKDISGLMIKLSLLFLYIVI
jgi:hypothetical protein